MNLSFSAAQIADILQGRVEGDPEVCVSDFAKIEEARAGQLSFLSNPKYEAYLYTTEASIVLVNEELELREDCRATLIRVPDAYAALAQLMQLVDAQLNVRPKGIDPRAVVAEGVDVSGASYIGAGAVIESGVKLAKGVHIYPNVYIGRDSQIGADTVLYPNVVVYHRCEVGARCILHAGAVIGADGFGFAPQLDGYHKIPQLGNVIIEDDVEIGANTCIDRATMGSTRIRRGAKLDNMVQIAHNCEVGSHTVMAAQGGMAGSSRIGSWCQTGGQVGIAGHLVIGDRVQLGGQTGVLGNIESDKVMLGSPAMDARNAMRAYAVLNKLPELYRTVGQLEREYNKNKNEN